ncbi:MAG: pyridine nucleotide-disulfide oxidoreductase [Deltaproteobacteria bacterium CG12_big_fil_rev_8_21_14_0_65_43_10]|nr:MAG: pyridine nucleotide-disulfide oxidoreductase [Deltaproteobacteria bacterium CG2_30_43_15]PIQ44376.1 MAG: pyridine nucleotide-disulfide oxidoreductase [Deltaproteobacteria bacterium CG12_big_fil_rev_8_21_14_0_65_43_10]PIU86835.1 MAG: pyridine nucleotide-disulfide oxidoreductase [Deltaproteobacteria bacterium CG06_land_8_20_14_3_00_44_19]PIX26597.1 MAG: pyridine nucleotide-disulfide oxidoreductase [Deltaproteobacteria bacterium CG_4_8_14_3_um_filter_43_13]PIZ20139.1 MAG: pyridine nucleoti
MFENAGITSIIARVTHVDTEKKMVELSDGRTIPYDKIILGTGASPMIPSMEGVDLDGVFTLRTTPDAEKIKRFLEERRARNLVFIGAGFINLELATLLSQTKPDYYNVTVIELLGHPLPIMLDAEMAVKIQEYLVEKGFRMMMGHKVKRILSENESVSTVELETGEKVDADMVMLSVGTRPNLELAKDMNLELGRFGIKVNKFLETSNPDVLAGGDCVEKIHFVTKNPAPSQLRGSAVIQGRLAAKRLAGYEIEFQGILNNSMVRVFDKYIAATGLTEELAQNEGFETISVMVNSRSKHGMIPGVKPWTLKLVFDKETQRIIGGQIISDSDSPVKEIDTINALILGEKTIPEMTTLICAGNPDCSSEPSLEPITIAAEQALQKLRK